MVQRFGAKIGIVAGGIQCVNSITVEAKISQQKAFMSLESCNIPFSRKVQY